MRPQDPLIRRIDLQQTLIDIAVSQVGVHEEGGDNSGPVVEMYQRVIGKAEKEPWCVSFVQYCVREVDAKYRAETVLAKTESSQLLWLNTPQIARIKLPEPGCIVVWTKFTADGRQTALGHCGIVREVLKEGFMLTVEGNTSPGDGIQREGDGVYLKRRKIVQDTGSFRVAGFLLPWAG